MHLFLTIAVLASLMTAPPDSVSSVYPKDATNAIEAYYRNLARKLATSPSAVPTAGNELEIIRSGKHYAELLFKDFEAARNTIELEVFILGDDPDGKRVLDTLAKKVQQGVSVRYIHDNLGNFGDSFLDGRPVLTGFYSTIPKTGIEVRQHTHLLLPDFTYTRLRWRNHRKINVIDGKIAYSGGMNLAQGSMSDWEDTHMRITGPAVQSLRAVFLDAWNNLSAGKAEAIDFTPSPEGGAPDGGKILQVVADGHDEPAYMMEETITWLLSHAKRYVWFETPYLLPSRPVAKAMKKAVERGIDVRIMVPEAIDLSTFDPAYRRGVKELIKYGVTVIYRRPPFVHSKTIVCDDYVTCIGSSNLDRLSLRSLNEINVLIYDAPTAAAHRESLSREQEQGKVADQAMVDSWDAGERLKQALFSIISNWL